MTAAIPTTARERLVANWKRIELSDKLGDPLKWEQAKLLATLKAQGASIRSLAKASGMASRTVKQYVMTWEEWGQNTVQPVWSVAYAYSTDESRAAARTRNDNAATRRTLVDRGYMFTDEMVDAFTRYPWAFEEMLPKLAARLVQQPAPIEVEEPVDEAPEPEPEQVEETEPEPESPARPIKASAVAAAPTPEPVETDDEREERLRVQQEAIRQRAEQRERERIAGLEAKGIHALGLLANYMHDHAPGISETLNEAYDEKVLSDQGVRTIEKHVERTRSNFMLLQAMYVLRSLTRSAERRRERGLESEVPEATLPVPRP